MKAIETKLAEMSQASQIFTCALTWRPPSESHCPRDLHFCSRCPQNMTVDSGTISEKIPLGSAFLHGTRAC